MEHIFYRHNRNPNTIVRFMDSNLFASSFRIPGRVFFEDISTGVPYMDEMANFKQTYTAITDKEDEGLLLLQVTP